MLLKNNTKYHAGIYLGIIERLASNEKVEEKLRDAGFTDPKVLGKGAMRDAYAVWGGPTQDVDLSAYPQIRNPVEIP